MACGWASAGDVAPEVRFPRDDRGVEKGAEKTFRSQGLPPLWVNRIPERAMSMPSVVPSRDCPWRLGEPVEYAIGARSGGSPCDWDTGLGTGLGGGCLMY